MFGCCFKSLPGGQGRASKQYVAGLRADRGRVGFNERERPPESGPGVVGRREKRKREQTTKERESKMSVCARAKARS
jgi:hypothetical protein